MTKEIKKHELFEILKGPHMMKDLCEEYSKRKGKNVFKEFHDNGDCEPHEIDLIYSGMIEHFCDGDFYDVQCCVRDSYDKNEDIYPEVAFWIDLNIETSHPAYNNYPKLEDFRKSYSIKTFSQFEEVMDSWPDFVKEGLIKIEDNRKLWENHLSPAPDTKEVYYHIKNYLGDDIKNSFSQIKDFKRIP